MGVFKTRNALYHILMALMLFQWNASAVAQEIVGGG